MLESRERIDIAKGAGVSATIAKQYRAVLGVYIYLVYITG